MKGDQLRFSISIQTRPNITRAHLMPSLPTLAQAEGIFNCVKSIVFKPLMVPSNGVCDVI